MGNRKGGVHSPVLQKEDHHLHNDPRAASMSSAANSVGTSNNPTTPERREKADLGGP